MAPGEVGGLIRISWWSSQELIMVTMMRPLYLCSRPRGQSSRVMSPHSHRSFMDVMSKAGLHTWGPVGRVSPI
jgi:hypothetical protein